MNHVIYTSPTGEGERNPSPEFIRSLFSQGEDYWQDKLGCGHGVFNVFQGEERQAMLEVTCKDGCGFYLLQIEKQDRGYQYHLAVNTEMKNSKLAKLHYGGEPFFVPAPLFIPRELAEKVAKDFCKTGKCPSCVRWVARSTLHWDSTTGEWTPPSP